MGALLFQLRAIDIKRALFILLFILFALFLLNQGAYAQCDPTSGDPMGCIPTDVYTDKTIEQILVDIINAALSLLFLIVLGFIIYGGYFWMTSLGNEERITKSKQILQASIIGLIIILASLSIVRFISEAIGVAPPATPEVTGLFTGELSEALNNIINAALTLAGVIALATMIYGGFRWMTAAGNEEQVAEAKRILTAGIIGLIIIIISWAIVNFIIGAING